MFLPLAALLLTRSLAAKIGHLQQPLAARKPLVSKCLFFIESYSVMSRSSRAQQFKIKVEPPSTLKDHCELIRGLTDKPDTVLESPDNSEQNQGGYFFDFFFEIFLHRALILI